MSGMRTKTMAELNQSLEDMLAEQRIVLDVYTKKCSALQRLTAEKDEAGSKYGEIGRNITRVQNIIFARGTFPSKFVSARAALMKKMQEAKSDDITVIRQRSLRDEVKADGTALQQMCTHPFVFSYDGYRGSSPNDFDDARCGHHVCVACNLREQSKATDKDAYSILPDDGTRLVRRDLRQFDKEFQVLRDEWYTIPFLQKLFEDSALGINLNWSESTKKKLLIA